MMSIANPKYVSELNELAQRSTDSAQAYQRALEEVDSGKLAAFCKRRVQEREKLAGQLRVRVEQLGEAPEEGGTLAGTAEKVLGKAKSIVMDDEQAILSELIRVEESLKDSFERYSQATTPELAQHEILGYYAEIAKTCSQLEELKADNAA